MGYNGFKASSLWHWCFGLVLLTFSSFTFATTCPNATVINPAALPTNQALVCGTTNDLNSTNVPGTWGAGNHSASYKNGNEALYTFTPTTTNTYNIAYAGQTWTSILVYQGCPNGGGTFVGGFASTGSSKNTNVTLTAGIEYFIWFDTWPTPNSPCAGTFTISVAPPPPTAPCTNATLYPVATVISNNTGVSQNIDTCVFGGEFSNISGLIVGSNYTFSATGGAGNYITIRSAGNATVLAHGPSPLTINNISLSEVSFHLSTNVNCGTDAVCHTTSFILLNPPTCLPPNATSYTGTVSFTSATINWTAIGNAASYQVEYAAGTLTPGSGTVVSTNTNSITLNGLTQNTLYQFRVRTNCTGTDGDSAWGTIFQFRTFQIASGGDVMTSPNFPSNYTNNAAINYSVRPQTTAGHNLSHQKASITFTAFNTESEFDSVVIHNGPDASAPIFDSGSTFNRPTCPNGSYTGTGAFSALNRTFTSTHPSGQLFVVFRSDDSVVAPGWSAYVTLTTEGRNDSCGSTFDLSNQNVFYSKRVLGADQYTFELTDLSDNSTQEIVKETWSFGTHEVVGVNYGKSYSVKSKARIGGNYAPYGAACTMATVAAPMAALTALYCDQSFTTHRSLYSNRVAGSEEFTFKVTNAADEVLEVVRTSNFFHILYNTSPEFYGTGGEFMVEVKVKVNGAYGAYGEACSVFIGEPNIVSRDNNLSISDKIEVYPNPFTDNFTVKLADFSNASIQVYDINGRIVQNNNVDNTFEVEMGQNLSQGMYVVRVEQNGEIQSFKMIKK